MHILLSLSVTILSSACLKRPEPEAQPAAAPPSALDAFRDALPETMRDIPQHARDTLRPFMDGAAFRGISYGPFREGQAPGGPNPSRDQIAEDLRILAPDWDAVRVYSSQAPTQTILSVIREEALPLKVMLGAWIAPDDPAANAAEVASAVYLAGAFPDVVAAVSVGNESQVDWSAHQSDPAVLQAALRVVRANVAQPVTTADDYNFWNKPRSHEIADEVDFIVLHAYAMWNGRSLDEAVPWTADTVAAIRAEHPGLPVVLGETGWATGLNPEGDEVQYIKAPAGADEQARFYAAFVAWAEQDGLPFFYFEAFDEPWKGSGDPREVEKHWGLYWVDRTPKPAISGQERP